MKEIVNSLIQSVRNHGKSLGDIKEAAADLGMVATGIVKESETAELVKELPVVSVITATHNIYETHQQNKLHKNVTALLDHLEQGNLDEITDFLFDLSKDPSRSDDFCETLLDITLTSPRRLKSKMLAGLLKAASSGELSYSEYDQLSLMITHASVPALNALDEFFKYSNGSTSMTTEDASSQRNIDSGLLYSLGVMTQSGRLLRISSTGVQLYRYGLSGHVIER